MEDLDVCAGETPRFAVVVEGKPVPDILWFKVPDQASQKSIGVKNRDISADSCYTLSEWHPAGREQSLHVCVRR